MSIRNITTAQSVTANSVDGLTGPITPSNTAAGIKDTLIYDFQSSLEFTDGAVLVFGKANLKENVSGTITNLNLPFFYDAVNDEIVQQRTSSDCIVASDAGGSIETKEGLNIILSDTYIANASLIKGEETCQPVFIGVDILLQSITAQFNLIGLATAGAAVKAAASFYNCTIWHFSNAPYPIRMYAQNTIIRGLTINNLHTGAGTLEFGAPLKLPPVGFKVISNFNSAQKTALSTAMNFGGRTEADDAKARYPWYGLEVINYDTYAGFPIYYSIKRGGFLIDAIGSLMPYRVETTGDISATSPTVRLPPMNTVIANSAAEAPFNVRRTKAGSAVALKTVKITFDESGYTLRVRRTKISTWTRRVETKTVAHGSKNIASNGGVQKTASADMDTSVQTLGNGTKTEEFSTANKTNDFTCINEDVFLFGEELVSRGLDKVVSGTEITLLLPIQCEQGRNTGTTQPTDGAGTNYEPDVYFYEYEIWAQKDNKIVGSTRKISFTPDDLDASVESGEIIELDLSLVVDGGFVSYRDLDSAGAAPQDLQGVYDCIKVYERLRDSNTDYDVSHTMSDVTVLPGSNGVDNATFFRIGRPNLERATTGRLVTQNSTTVFVRTSLSFSNPLPQTAIISKVAIQATGNIDMDVFASVVNLQISAHTLTNLPSLIPTTCRLSGTYTYTGSADISFTFAGTSFPLYFNAYSLEIINNGTGTLFIQGPTASEFFDAPSGTGTIKYSFTRNVVIDTSNVGECYFRIKFAGATSSIAKTFGVISASSTSHAITINTADGFDIGTAATITITGKDVHAQVVSFDLNNSAQVDVEIFKNELFNAAITPSTKVGNKISLIGEPEVSYFTITVASGADLGGGETNAAFGEQKTSQIYCDFIAIKGVIAEFSFPGLDSVRLNPTYHRIETERDGSDTSKPELQKVRVTSGTINDIVIKEEFTGTVSIGLTIKGDTTVDYPAVGAEVDRGNERQSEKQKAIDKKTYPKIAGLTPPAESDYND